MSTGKPHEAAAVAPMRGHQEACVFTLRSRAQVSFRPGKRTLGLLKATARRSGRCVNCDALARTGGYLDEFGNRTLKSRHATPMKQSQGERNSNDATGPNKYKRRRRV